MSNAQIRDALVQVDGAGSGVDADTLDGLSSTSFLRNDQNGSIGGVLSASGLETAQGLIVAGELIIDERGNWLGPQPMSNIQIRDALTQVDGAGSGVDADTLDGLSSTSFLRNDQNGSVGGVLSASGLETAQGLIVAGELIIDDRGQWLGPPANEQYPNQRCLDSSGWRRQRRGRRHAGQAVKLVIIKNDQNGNITGLLSVAGLDSSQAVKINGLAVIDANGNWTGPQPMSNIQIRDALIQVDGIGSGVDADMLDGISSTTF